MLTQTKYLATGTYGYMDIDLWIYGYRNIIKLEIYLYDFQNFM